MRYVGFRGMDWNIGFRDGLAGHDYNEGANSDPYDHGYLAGKRQRRLEVLMTSVMGLGLGALVAVQALFWIGGAG